MGRERAPTVTHRPAHLATATPCTSTSISGRARPATVIKALAGKLSAKISRRSWVNRSPSRASVMNTVIVTKSARLAPASSSVRPSRAKTSRTWPSKSGGERAVRGILDRHLSGEPDRTAAFGNDRLRIGAGLRRLALDVASLQRFRHLSVHLVRQRTMLRAMASDATSFFENAQRRAAGWLAAWDGQGIPRPDAVRFRVVKPSLC